MKLTAFVHWFLGILVGISFGVAGMIVLRPVPPAPEPVLQVKYEIKEVVVTATPTPAPSVIVGFDEAVCFVGLPAQFSPIFMEKGERMQVSGADLLYVVNDDGTMEQNRFIDGKFTTPRGNRRAIVVPGAAEVSGFRVFTGEAVARNCQQ